ncbi:helix-turn-helix transcriptional regulator [Streptomyces scopuliridis]|uniref:Helix-turn-helix transcriptional regulator n=1 Tax=Streptomyces scopuliridis TaxID=452529 RepID=A0ACD4ZNB8_9ACTN|nr:helix-turn-helix transcriptional regulator [Streptomyces scopuliridis]WSB99679.1 helix-turn-helix transcriptional regulator [Streptomyces scopuliridis]WSC06622.1 helix-turn-helix transcriptional regulator [Streptomyces scopuliridis]
MTRKNLPPSARQRRLGTELRRLREQMDLSVTKAAALLGSSQPQVSSVELGRFAVSADRVRAMAHSYTCTDEALIEALAGMTGGRTRGWWEEYRDILPPDTLELAELEHHATAMRTASVIHLPGLLQTRAHAYAVISDDVPTLAPPEVEHRVSYRIKRQAVLYRENPTPLTAIIHEAALRMGFGGADAARAQLENLLDMSERQHITIRVIPFGAGTFPSSGQSIYLMAGTVPALDTVQLDSDHGAAFLDAQPQLVKYRMVLDRMEACSLEPAASRDLIRRIAEDI